MNSSQEDLLDDLHVGLVHDLDPNDFFSAPIQQFQSNFDRPEEDVPFHDPEELEEIEEKPAAKVTKQDMKYTPVPVFECAYCVRDTQAQMEAFAKTSQDSLKVSVYNKMKRWCEQTQQEEQRAWEQADEWSRTNLTEGGDCSQLPYSKAILKLKAEPEGSRPKLADTKLSSFVTGMKKRIEEEVRMKKEEEQSRSQATIEEKGGEVETKQQTLFTNLDHSVVFEGPVTITNWARTRAQRILLNLSFESEPFDIFSPRYSSQDEETMIDDSCLKVLKKRPYKKPSPQVKPEIADTSSSSSIVSSLGSITIGGPKKVEEKKETLLTIPSQQVQEPKEASNDSFMCLSPDDEEVNRKIQNPIINDQNLSDILKDPNSPVLTKFISDIPILTVESPEKTSSAEGNNSIVRMTSRNEVIAQNYTQPRQPEESSDFIPLAAQSHRGFHPETNISLPTLPSLRHKPARLTQVGSQSSVKIKRPPKNEAKFSAYKTTHSARGPVKKNKRIIIQAQKTPQRETAKQVPRLDFYTFQDPPTSSDMPKAEVSRVPPLKELPKLSSRTLMHNRAATARDGRAIRGSIGGTSHQKQVVSRQPKLVPQSGLNHKQTLSSCYLSLVSPIQEENNSPQKMMPVSQSMNFHTQPQIRSSPLKPQSLKSASLKEVRKVDKSSGSKGQKRAIQSANVNRFKPNVPNVQVRVDLSSDPIMEFDSPEQAPVEQPDFKIAHQQQQQPGRIKKLLSKFSQLSSKKPPSTKLSKSKIYQTYCPQPLSSARISAEVAKPRKSIIMTRSTKSIKQPLPVEPKQPRRLPERLLETTPKETIDLQKSTFSLLSRPTQQVPSHKKNQTTLSSQLSKGRSFPGTKIPKLNLQTQDSGGDSFPSARGGPDESEVLLGSAKREPLIMKPNFIKQSYLGQKPQVRNSLHGQSQLNPFSTFATLTSRGADKQPSSSSRQLSSREGQPQKPEMKKLVSKTSLIGKGSRFAKP